MEPLLRNRISFTLLNARNVDTRTKWLGLMVQPPRTPGARGKEGRYHVVGLDVANPKREIAKQDLYERLWREHNDARKSGGLRSIPMPLYEAMPYLDKRHGIGLTLLYQAREEKPEAERQDRTDKYYDRGSLARTVFMYQLCGCKSGDWRRTLKELKDAGFIRWREERNPKHPELFRIHFDFVEGWLEALGQIAARCCSDPVQASTAVLDGVIAAPATGSLQHLDGVTTAPDGVIAATVPSYEGCVRADDQYRLRRNPPQVPPSAACPPDGGVGEEHHFVDDEGKDTEDKIDEPSSPLLELANAIHGRASSNAEGKSSKPVPQIGVVLNRLRSTLGIKVVELLDDGPVLASVIESLSDDYRYKVLDICDDIVLSILNSVERIESNREEERLEAAEHARAVAQWEHDIETGTNALRDSLGVDPIDEKTFLVLLDMKTMRNAYMAVVQAGLSPDGWRSLLAEIPALGAAHSVMYQRFRTWEVVNGLHRTLPFDYGKGDTAAASRIQDTYWDQVKQFFDRFDEDAQSGMPRPPGAHRSCAAEAVGAGAE